MHGSVTVHMDAPVDQVWDLVSDVTRIGEFSPETLEREFAESGFSIDGLYSDVAGTR